MCIWMRFRIDLTRCAQWVGGMAPQDSLRDLSDVAERACLSAGEALAGCLEREVVGLEHDLKSEADQVADGAIRRILEPTGIPILSEEGPAVSRECLDSRLWIVDPLDGTINFEKGIPIHCVSIALWDDRRPVFGIVYDCCADELLVGGSGMPARCGETSMSVSNVRSPGESVLATGFPSGRSYEETDLLGFVKRVQRFRKTRLFGSAAWSLASVARGRVDAYWEEDIYLWDVAAGIALVQGAGGCARYGEVDWETMKLTVTAAGTSELLSAMRESDLGLG